MIVWLSAAADGVRVVIDLPSDERTGLPRLDREAGRVSLRLGARPNGHVQQTVQALAQASLFPAKHLCVEKSDTRDAAADYRTSAPAYRTLSRSGREKRQHVQDM
jgi:hypothetical protein